MSRLTLDEMVLQMSRGGANHNGYYSNLCISVLFAYNIIGPAPAISRLGINPYQWGTECLSGDVNAGPATSFPMAIGMVSVAMKKK